MGKLLIVEPAPIAAMVITPTGTGGSNPLTPDPKEIYDRGTAGTVQIDIDMGAAVALDSFFLGFTNASDTATMIVQTGTGLGSGLSTIEGQTPIRAADAIGERSHGFRHLDSPVTSRYWRIAFYSEGMTANNQFGILLVGKAFSPEWDREWGSGRRPIDTGKATQLIGGGFGIEKGARKAAFSWTFGDLTDAETQELWAMTMRLGATDPLLVVENASDTVGVNEQLHYGLFSRLDQFERRRPEETKWQLEIEQWV